MSGPRTIAELRAEIPALATRGGASANARFDGPGGTQVPQSVIDAMVHYLTTSNANAHWGFPESDRSDAMVEDAREVLAAFTGGQPEEVVFGANMTTLTMHLARGLGRGWQAGDEVIVTGLDHHANVAPWEALAIERGIVLRWWAADPLTGELDLTDLPGLIGPRTRLIAVGGASNALGTITDIRTVASLAKQHGVLVLVDAVHLAAHRRLDVAALGVDFLVCSPYKFYGPHAGVLWGRHELLERVDAPRLRPAPSTGPERLQTGTAAFEAIAGCAAAVRWLASVAGSGGTLSEQLDASFSVLEAREMVLFTQLWDGLGTIPGLRRFGLPPGPGRTATVSFTVDGHTAQAVSAILTRHGCSASHGDFYAYTAAEVAGVLPNGWVRLGLAAYSDDTDVERVLVALKTIGAPTS
ncbi:MAG: cysteine desulfurase-like protein [Gemmatimonadota bacterium]